ncbi:MAG: prepilin-type N-terminal cleavage/methylation domain-containing protein [Candidatus Omnitrophica bacterium]|nr:prepilin-type N-terminal cleavage/methylation domain-containing protein [Candidatus Omnitrophota bacterium]
MADKRGFTLIEVMVAITILAGASLFIFQAFFTSLAVLDQANDRLMLLGPINNTVSKTKLALVNREIALPYINEGDHLIDGKKYHYVIKAEKIKGKDTVCRITVACVWNEGLKRLTSERDLIWPCAARKS